MAHWETKPLSDRETDEINNKHKQGEHELASEPSMYRVGYDDLSMAKIMTEVWRQYGQKPTNQWSTLKNNKKCKKKKKSKCRHGRGYTRSKWETNGRELSNSFLDKILDSIDISNQSIDDKLRSILISEKWGNMSDIDFTTYELTETKRKWINSRKTRTSLLFNSSDCRNNIGFWIFGKPNKDGYYRNNKECKREENAKKSNQDTEHVRYFPFFEANNKRSQEKSKKTRYQK